MNIKEFLFFTSIELNEEYEKYCKECEENNITPKSIKAWWENLE